MSEIKQKKFLVLKVDSKNKNYRIFSETLCKVWIDSPKLKDGHSFDIECAIDDGEYDYEHIKDELVVGRVVKLEIEDKSLFATCEFRLEGDAPYLKEINEQIDFLDKCAVVPKGKGAVRNQIVQDDYELYGFNLIWAHESSFVEDAPTEAVEANANA